MSDESAQPDPRLGEWIRVVDYYWQRAGLAEPCRARLRDDLMDDLLASWSHGAPVEDLVAVDPAQLAWARSELEKPADMRIVFGHHPIYSGGLHGSLPHMEKLLLPMLEQHADLYCCGHEHNLQFLRSAAGFPLVVSGAAGEERTAWRKPQTEFFSGHMGTTFLRIDRSGIEIEMRDGRSRKTLFTKHVPRRNNG